MSRHLPDREHKKQDWVIALEVEHNRVDQPHRFVGHDQIGMILEALDSRLGRVLHARTIIRLMKAGMNPECPLCWNNIRRPWRVHLRRNRALAWDYQYVGKNPGMSMDTARHARVDSHKYQAVVRDDED